MQKVNGVDLTIIILSYKSKEHLKVLLPSVFASTKKYSYEVIVVDNGSKDGTAEWLGEQVTSDPFDKLRAGKLQVTSGTTPDFQLSTLNFKLIRNANVGFSAGNNVGIKQSSGKYVLLLNPDTKVEPNTFELMLDFMESRPDVGISGCKIIKPGGKLDLACRRRFPNPWNSFARLFLKNNKNYNYADISDSQSMEVDSVVGAFLLIRKTVIDKIGLLDEKFFMYGEDLDWCWRCKEADFKVWYYPQALIIHYKGSSSAKTPFLALKWFHQSMWIFYKKHYAKQYFFAFNWLVYLGIYLRLLMLTALNLFKKNPVVSK